jgi:hypothetical protein
MLAAGVVVPSLGSPPENGAAAPHQEPTARSQQQEGFGIAARGTEEPAAGVRKIIRICVVSHVSCSLVVLMSCAICLAVRDGSRSSSVRERP